MTVLGTQMMVLHSKQRFSNLFVIITENLFFEWNYALQLHKLEKQISSESENGDTLSPSCSLCAQRVSLLYSGRQCITWLYKLICPDAYGQEKLWTVTYFTLKSEPLCVINCMAILLMRYLRGTLEHNDQPEKPLSKGIEGAVIGLPWWNSV